MTSSTSQHVFRHEEIKKNSFTKITYEYCNHLKNPSHSFNKRQKVFNIKNVTLP